MSSRTLWDSIKQPTIQDDYESTLLYNIRDTFTDNLYYEQVYKNFDITTLYKVIISQGNKDVDLSGNKKLWSYPYDTIQFSTGDYLTWNSKNWLIITLDSERIYEVYGEIMECTQSLNRYNRSGVLIKKQTPFFSIKGGSETEDTDILTGTGTAYAYVPKDDDVDEWISDLKETEKLVLFYIPDEKSTYKLVDTDLKSSSTLCKLSFKVYESPVDIDTVNNTVQPRLDQIFTLEIDQDDLSIVDGIDIQLSATVQDGNGEVIDKSVTWSVLDTDIATIDSDGLLTSVSVGSTTVHCEMPDNSSVSDDITLTVASVVVDEYQIILTPNDTVISVGEVLYNIELIKNGVSISDTFDINIAGENEVDSTYYYFIQTSNTQFWIQNKYGHDEMTIDINIDGVLYSEVITLTLRS